MTTYTPGQLAKHLQVSRSKVMSWIRAGTLAAFDVGAGGSPRYRISASAVDDFQEKRRIKPAVKKVRNRRIVERTTKQYF